MRQTALYPTPPAVIAFTLMVLACLPSTLSAQSTLDGPVTILGGFPDLLNFSTGRITQDLDTVKWNKKAFRILLDKDNNNQGAEFSIFNDVSSTSGADAGVMFKLNAGDSWMALDGNLGVGTMSPQSKLAVDGTVTAREFVATLDGWPDFVFDDDYWLMPLEELEAEVRSLGHLPGIPSAQEVATAGVGIGEMQAKLLLKVEELTLYLFELARENERLRARIASVEERAGAR